MQAGTLTEQILIQRQTWKTNEDFGNQKTAFWSDHIHTRANVVYKDGMRMDDNNELFFAQHIIFNVRIYHDIQDLDRIVFKQKKYRILNIQDDRTVMRKIITTELINE